MTITFKNFDGQQLGRKFNAGTIRFGERSVRAMQAAARRGAEELERQGRDDMIRGGFFGSRRWQEGLRARVSFQSRTDINIRLTHDVFYWKVFEYGARIFGKPMLWIPLPFAGVPKGVRARDFAEPLFKVERAGRVPLLVSKTGPKYYGKESVTIPRKWHLRDVTRRVSRQLNGFYKEAMRNGR